MLKIVYYDCCHTYIAASIPREPGG
jgi:hypothetical protein